MSHPVPHESTTLKPQPSNRRPFELPSDSVPPTPTGATTSGMNSTMDLGSGTPSRTRSILNLTSSTLFGIYQPTGYDSNREDATPWGTGAQTPVDGSRHASFDLASLNKGNSVPDTYFRKGPNGQIQRRRRSTAASQRPTQRVRRGFTGYLLPLIGREAALFTLGALYGLLIGHLHDTQNFSAVKLDINRFSQAYILVWGAAGILLGEALPYVDTLWDSMFEDDDYAAEEKDERSACTLARRGVGAWSDVLRSIGAFVGIAFAIRKLPWESTLQLSLTLALANPAVWYLIDRSAPGFMLSALVSLVGTAFVLGVSPEWVPSPPLVLQSTKGGLNVTSPGDSDEKVLGMFSQESVGAVTWIASVLFVSSVCFGNLGRRLARRDF